MLDTEVIEAVMDPSDQNETNQCPIESRCNLQYSVHKDSWLYQSSVVALLSVIKSQLRNTEYIPESVLKVLVKCSSSDHQGNPEAALSLWKIENR